MSEIKSVAILGVGKMGSAIAKELAVAGFDVTLWNRNQTAAENLASELNLSTVMVAQTPKDAILSADIVLCLFTNGLVTQSILLDDPTVLNEAKSNLIIVDMGTSGVESARVLAKNLALKNISFIDAPVSGSVATVAAHQLLVMASGDESVIDRAIPIFSVFAKKIAYLGVAGSGQSMKLAVNLIVHSLNAAISEGLALATSSGIEATTAYDVFEDSVVAAPFLKYKRAAFLDPELPVAMRIDTVLKDLDLILSLGSSLGLTLTATSGVEKLFSHAKQADFGHKDMSALFGFISQS